MLEGGTSPFGGESELEVSPEGEFECIGDNEDFDVEYGAAFKQVSPNTLSNCIST